jgi:hypothetical protein
MKKLAALLSIILSFSEANGQVDYISYHKEIIQAEKLYFLGRHKECLAKYDQIFSTYKKPFAKDCFVAVQFAVIHKDTPRCDRFLTLAFENGVNWNDLRRSVHTLSLIANPANSRRIGKLYTAGRAVYLQRMNKTIRDSIYYLIRRDNADRVTGPKGVRDSNKIFHVYGNTVLDENINILDRITKREGYPGQHMIGLKDFELDKGEPRPFIFESPASLIFYHHYCGLYLMKEDMLKAIKGGELLPADYALIYEWAYDAYFQSKGELRGSNNVYHFKTKCPYPPRDKFYNNFLNGFNYSRDTTLVNRCREEIGMQSIQHQAIKNMFARNNKIVFSSGMFDLY